jgi:predicted nucleotidyltransferase
MTPLESLQQKREDIQRITAKHGAHNIRVFGSVARGEAGPDSDIDLLIEKGPTTTSLMLNTLQEEGNGT